MDEYLTATHLTKLLKFYMSECKCTQNIKYTKLVKNVSQLWFGPYEIITSQQITSVFGLKKRQLSSDLLVCTSDMLYSISYIHVILAQSSTEFENAEL